MWGKSIATLAFSASFLITLCAQADRAPVLFLHGMGVDPTRYETAELYNLFKAKGHSLLVARTPRSGTLEQRAAALRAEISRLVPRGVFHIIGHSMGGLEARLAIHKYGLGSRVLSLTTIGTPHRGSSMADFAVRDTQRGTPQGRIADRVLEFLGRDTDGIRDLTTKFMTQEFNQVVKDDPRVRYFSMAFFIPTPITAFSGFPLLWASHEIMFSRGDILNDGLVSVQSASWGEVIFTGSCDHRAETLPSLYLGCDYRVNFRRALNNLNRVFN